MSQIGARLNAVYTAAEILAGGTGFTKGQTIKGFDRYTYVFGQATGAITNGLATVNVVSGNAAPTGGTSIAQAALATGEFGWFRTNAAQDAVVDGIKPSVAGTTITPAP